MKAYELLARLRLLGLFGYENGQFIWIGSDKNWRKIPYEEESILRDYELKLK